MHSKVVPVHQPFLCYILLLQDIVEQESSLVKFEMSALVMEKEQAVKVNV